MTIDDPFQLTEDVVRALRDKYPAHHIELMDSDERYPGIEQMEQMIKTAFWATLATEEREEIVFSLQFCTPESNELGNYYIFRESIPLDKDNLTKLALSVDSQKRFGVFPDSDGQLKIWGFGSRSLLGVFKIGTYGAGRVVVTLGHHSLLIEADQARFVMNSDDLEKTIFWGKPAGIFPAEHDDFCRKYLTGRFLQSCRYILNIIRAKKHGGTLLITPEHDDYEVSLSLPLKYAASENWSKASRSFEPLLERFHLKHTVSPSDFKPLIFSEEASRFEEDYRQSLDDIAALARIDGAVVADYNLNVLAFGAKIKTRVKSSENIPLLQFPFRDVESAKKTTKPVWGTRHQSAADFALERKNSIAFVCSEDGAATAFTFDSEHGKVSALRHLEYLQEGKFD